MNKILVVVAHPDDETLGCGATIARRVAEGDEAYCLVLSDGESARFETPAQVDSKLVLSRADSFRKATTILGVKSIYIDRFPDNRFDSVDLLDLVKVIEAIKLEIQPDIVMTHFQGDLNIDHRRTFEAVLTACRPLPNESVREILSFENMSSTEWAPPGGFGNAFQPNEFWNVENYLEQKIEALKCYGSEIRPFPHPRSYEMVKISAQRWGSSVGLPCVEPFVKVRTVRV